MSTEPLQFDQKMRGTGKLSSKISPLSLVYDCNGDSRDVTRSTVGSYKNRKTLSHAISFDSNYESGNLSQVYTGSTGDFVYYMFLRSDPGLFNTLWFYFSVTNVIPNVEYTIHIVNIVNKAQNWRFGMQPLMFVQPYKLRYFGHPNFLSTWSRVGDDVNYYVTNSKLLQLKNYVSLGDKKREKRRKLFTLTFKMRFPNAFDTYYFAYCYPFSYSDLNEYLRIIEQKAKKDVNNISFTRSALCKTVLGRQCDFLTITESGNNGFRKKGVVITARVHPGETAASWVTKGIIDYLTGYSEIAEYLRSEFVFKIVPMLNPDGVACGFNRVAPTSNKPGADQGVNLNSIWHKADRDLHPTIYYTKQMISKFIAEREVVLFIDLHGHCADMPNFVLGYSSSDSDDENKPIHIFPKIIERLCVISRNGEDIFRYRKDCIFNVNKIHSTGVAPAVIHREFGIPNCYTLECSLGGNSSHHFKIGDYENFGKVVCEAILLCFRR